MMIYLTLIVLLFIEGLLSNYVPYLAFSFPLKFFLVMLGILFICCVFKTDKKKLYLLAFIMGIIYDFTYTNIYFWHSLLFSLALFIVLWLEEKNRSPTLNILLAFFMSCTVDYLIAIFLFSVPFALSLYFNYILGILLAHLIFFILIKVYFSYFNKPKGISI